MVIVNWLMLIVLSTLAASWIAYGLLKAVNGIVYEMTILRRYMDEEE